MPIVDPEHGAADRALLALDKMRRQVRSMSRMTTSLRAHPGPPGSPPGALYARLQHTWAALQLMVRRHRPACATEWPHIWTTAELPTDPQLTNLAASLDAEHQRTSARDKQARIARW